MPIENNQGIRDILASICTTALVGASDKNSRPSHKVMEYLQQKGYRIIPVKPRLEGKQLLGETVDAELA
ncbi:CoA-binding protein, partial [Marinobacter sp. SBS5]|uniref:CoA-binding protein n=1 Tax=Marinobacter sp. SBS5 TaxID=3401754 RepID=UPI003AAD8A79